MASKLSLFRKVELINLKLSPLAGNRDALELEFVGQSISNKEEDKLYVTSNIQNVPKYISSEINLIMISYNLLH